MSRVFARGPASLPRVATALGSRVWDTDGQSYLDASGGAIVVGVGHGNETVIEAAARQARAVSYAHATMFAADVLDDYAEALAGLVPVDDAHVYPVSGGSEAVETALKMARAYHLARGEDRHVIVSRRGSYHGNTRGALDASGRDGLRAPYAPWLGAAVHAPSPYEYRCPFPEAHPDGCAAAHVAALDKLFAEWPVAAFIAEPVAGAGLGACVPPSGYWPGVAEACRRHGVLLIADEVMTGFGRTGTWFGLDHWGVRADIVTAGKGAASGYWPLGLAIASGEVHATIAGAFTHGFTYSHHLVGAATGLAVLDALRPLVPGVADKGRFLLDGLRAVLAADERVGDVRGLGLLTGIELVADRATRRPYPRAHRLAERVTATARDLGLLIYHGTGCADGTDGDLVLLGPPLSTSEDELAEIIALCARAIAATR
ncbi:adenosylmethionine-8-amino-7-oxononanoate aminotransferase [Actinorhabdospora filicis]|uniref:Adenosylmethionine-8-amino-7-oxononanoate aminotransferase n=1 Tax=Actinorhabdospora filicis TaxID=1785913 RepID=A0A9W6SNP0_9ACTN|nr:aminotransferase class III-fold pyridoxal phosphate-dependent enzyme [Actinorhabdospora filicis]GLZ79563.1 adenosylmethionine-8-amino-7-oxononanoate aminotransferase [Actinorhabdospora filicis]